jgi:hypothetical protein
MVKIDPPKAELASSKTFEHVRLVGRPGMHFVVDLAVESNNVGAKISSNLVRDVLLCSGIHVIDGCLWQPWCLRGLRHLCVALRFGISISALAY